MRKLARIGQLAGMLLLGIAQLSWGWNNTGHKTASLVAWDQLTPEVRAKITAILEKHPQHDQYLVLPEAPQDEYTTLDAYLAAATWPDLVRTPMGKNRLYHHGVWHYVDYPFVLGTLPAGKTAEAPVEEWKVGSDPANLLQARAKIIAELKDEKTPAEEKAVALCWLLHLTEDIHQPLHAVSLFSTEYSEGDKGGNSLMVSNEGAPINLHAFWDGQMGKNEDVRTIRFLASKLEQEYPVSSLEAEVKIHDPKGWAQESYQFAKEVVYQNGTIKALNKAKYDADKTAAVPELSKEYLAQAKKVAHQRLALAGYRLGYELNEIFGSKASTQQTAAPLPALHYVSRSQFNIPVLLKPAPADDSEQTKQDLAKLRELQEQRTPEQVAQAQKDANITIAVFAQVIAKDFDFAKHPKTNQVLDAVGWDIHWITEDAKNTWKRPRPYVLDKSLKVVLDKPQNTSYPSGHTTRAYGWAVTLGAIFPEKKQELLQRAAEIGLGRQIGGVHYPSDVAAGEILGKEIGAKIVASPTFQADLKDIQAELSGK